MKLIFVVKVVLGEAWRYQAAGRLRLLELKVEVVELLDDGLLCFDLFEAGHDLVLLFHAEDPRHLNEVGQVDQVNELDVFVLRQCFGTGGDEAHEEIHGLTTEHLTAMTVQVPLEGHSDHAFASFEDELVLLLVVLRQATVPYLTHHVGRDEEVRCQLVRQEELLKLVVNLISYNFGCLLYYLKWLVLRPAIFQKFGCFNFKVHQLWDLQLLKLINLVHVLLGEAVGDHLELVRLVENGDLLEFVELWKEAVQAEYALVHSLYELIRALGVLVFEDLEVVHGNELVIVIEALEVLVSQLIQLIHVCIWALEFLVLGGEVDSAGMVAFL